MSLIIFLGEKIGYIEAGVIVNVAYITGLRIIKE